MMVNSVTLITGAMFYFQTSIEQNLLLTRCRAHSLFSRPVGRYSSAHMTLIFIDAVVPARLILVRNRNCETDASDEYNDNQYHIKVLIFLFKKQYVHYVRKQLCKIFSGVPGKEIDNNLVTRAICDCRRVVAHPRHLVVTNINVVFSITNSASLSWSRRRLERE
ncbi:hypothetical protein AVEN_53709-1 [Araneus ventricosus]|uniref:Uncharacterized protein n=1 Tax=Araneus ventricosus TaxID=182803 RepID=A0A4Y2SYY0_ARAVE|nr:hypothetical protein AVEN_53709-1 [Araneus ventricosus]